MTLRTFFAVVRRVTSPARGSGGFASRQDVTRFEDNMPLVGCRRSQQSVERFLRGLNRRVEIRPTVQHQYRKFHSGREVDGVDLGKSLRQIEAPGVLLLAVVSAALWEERRAQTRTVDFALIVFPFLSFALSRFEASVLPDWAPLPFLVATAVLSYPRFAFRRKTPFWYVNLLLILVWCFPGSWSPRYRELSHLAAYSGLASVVWALALSRLRDSTARLHGGLVLWVLGFGAGGIQVAALLQAGDRPDEEQRIPARSRWLP